MNTQIKLGGVSVAVQTFIDLKYPTSCDSMLIFCGPFALLGFGSDSEARKALIAALQEADAELDAAITAREKKEQVAA